MMFNPDYYLVVKLLHMTTAAISITGFAARGILSLTDHSVMNRKWVRIIPHINDSILLICAVWLTLFIQQYPLQNSWLTAKLIGLIIYVGFGVWALKKGTTKKSRILYFGLALLTFAYIAGVALTKSPFLGQTAYLW